MSGNRSGGLPMYATRRTNWEAVVFGLIAAIVVAVGAWAGWSILHPKSVPCDFCGQIVDRWYDLSLSPQYSTPKEWAVDTVLQPEEALHKTQYEVCSDCYEKVVRGLQGMRE